MYRRTLIVSNQALSKSTSNGRTLGMLFKGWPKDKLAQFCLSAADADRDVCLNYFAVSDGDVLASVKSLGRKRADGVAAANAAATTAGAVASPSKRYGKRTALKSVLRNVLWNSGLWKSKAYGAWLDDFAPEIVVLQAGDAAFMNRIAVDIANKYGAKLVIFNTEGYVFFDHNYLTHHWSDAVAFPLFRRSFRRSFMGTFRRADLCIYLNDKLNDDYQALMPHRSAVIYNSSDMPFTPSEALQTPPTFAYLGNLGIKRPEALAEFAGILRKVCPEASLDVYGRVPEQYVDLFDNTEGLNYHGLVSYERVRHVIAHTDFVIHVEKDDPVLTGELRYAFSTKIADSLCSGRNFIVYAPATLACSQYIAATGAAWHASTAAELEAVLHTALFDASGRARRLDTARRIAAENHSADGNAEKFRNSLELL